jgi:ABC-2 type transport system permease protein
VTASNSVPTRPFYWSVRREIWENRSVYLGPLIFAAFILVGLLFRLHDLPERRRAALLLEPAKAQHAIQLPYDAAIGMLAVAAFLIGTFYCLDALYGERRERSILFWKSLPVSDVTTVLAKITVPLAVLPVICMTLSVCLHIIWLLVSSIVLLIGGVSPATTFAHVHLLHVWVAMIYFWLTIVLWHAPIYCWLLLVSVWARRTPFLWAVLPFVAAGIFERVAFGTTNVSNFIQYRLIGWFFRAEIMPPHGTGADPLSGLTPGRYFSTPGLWLGLILAAACLFAAIRLRRYRGPV